MTPLPPPRDLSVRAHVQKAWIRSLEQQPGQKPPGSDRIRRSGRDFSKEAFIFMEGVSSVNGQCFLKSSGRSNLVVFTVMTESEERLERRRAVFIAPGRRKTKTFHAHAALGGNKPAGKRFISALLLLSTEPLWVFFAARDPRKTRAGPRCASRDTAK